jgi:hypothetical protein
MSELRRIHIALNEPFDADGVRRAARDHAENTLGTCEGYLEGLIYDMCERANYQAANVAKALASLVPASTCQQPYVRAVDALVRAPSDDWFWSMNPSDRQSGRTTAQMLACPEGAIYVWPNSQLYYPECLKQSLGRRDLEIVTPSWVCPPNLRGATRRVVAHDHATRCEGMHGAWLGQALATGSIVLLTSVTDFRHAAESRARAFASRSRHGRAPEQKEGGRAEP